MKEETDGGELQTEELSRETNTSSLSRKSRDVSLSPTKALRHFPHQDKKKLFIYPSDQNMDSSGGSSQQTLVDVRDVFIHTSTKHALKKTAFFARGAVFCVAIPLQTSSRRPGR